MKATALFTTLAGTILGVAAQSPAWGQCGGISWTGSTTCVSGTTCTKINDYYSQCIPGAVTNPTPTVTTTTATTPTTTTTTSTGASPTGSQIRAVSSPVYHFYLQNKGGAPVLGPESSSGRFTIGGTIALLNSDGSKQYLNVQTSASTSYKPITLNSTATTTVWGLEGDTIITTSPRQLNFIACATSDANYYNVYLQTGNDQPAGASCTLQTLHLPCLC